MTQPVAANAKSEAKPGTDIIALKPCAGHLPNFMR
jgi:hypothetical protein